MKKIQYNGISKLLSGITTKINSLIDIVELKADWEQTDPTAFDYIKNKPDSLDEKVKQENTTTDADYRVLLSKSANDVTENDKAWKNSNLKYNPSTGNLQTTKLNGNTVPSGSDTIALTSDIPTVVNTYDGTSTDAISGMGVKAALDTLPEPMVYKGSLGTDGTISDLPMDGSATIGDTYKVITEGDYGNNTYHAKVGDTFICYTKTSSANTWTLIPSGDEPSGTVTSITIKATSPIAVNSSSAITTSGTRTISHVESGVTASSYGDSSAQTPGFGGTFKALSATVNATGHVTVMGEHTVTIPSAVATTSASGLMSSTDKSNLDNNRAVSEIRLTNEDLNNVTTVGFYYAAGGNTVTNKPSGYNNFGLVVIHNASGSQYTQIISNENGSYRRIKKADGTWTNWVEEKYTDTTYTASGVVSIDANNNITSTAEVNQNTFAKVKVGSTTVTADAKQDTLELVAGDNVTLTPDATNDKITIVSTDTNTHRPIKLNDTEILGNNTTPLNLKNGNNISMTNSSGTVTINATGIPTKTSDLTNDSNFVSDANYVHTDVNFTSAYETKLSGIEPNAQVNTVTGVKGNSETNYRTGNINITKSNIGLGSVDNTSDTTKKTNFTGSIASGNTGFVTGGDIYTALQGKADTGDIPTDFVKASTGGTFSGNITVAKSHTGTTDNQTILTVGNNKTSTGMSSGALKLFSERGTGKFIRLFNDNTLTGSSADRRYKLPVDKPNDSELAVVADIPTALSDLTADETHRVVTDTQISTWNSKAGSDVNVTQTLVSTNKNYPLLFSTRETSDTTASRTGTAQRNNSIYVNPSTGNLQTTKINGVTVGSSPEFTDTTYTFTGGTNKFSVSVNGGTASDVNITPSIENNITGSGTRTNGYLAKFSGTNTVTNGPQIGSDTTKFLRNDGSWEVPSGSVTGVKGNSESTYRTGNVNLTPANIGALALTGGVVTGNVTIRKDLVQGDTDAPALLQLQARYTPTGGSQVNSTASLRAYSDHAGNGANLVLNSGGNLFIGSGEAPNAHYNLYPNNGSEITFITADSVVNIQANAQTIANRKGLKITTGGEIVPNVADAATNDAGSIGTSAYKWANIYATNLNGVAIGDSPKFTDASVTGSSTHYSPSTASGQDKTASASGATAAWSLDVVKGVTLNTDGKGHVTGISVTSGKTPANPVNNKTITIQQNGTTVDSFTLNQSSNKTINVTDNKVTQTDETSTGWHTLALTENDKDTYTEGVYKIKGLSMQVQTIGVANTEGVINLAIGNSTKKTAADNYTGRLYMYNGNGARDIIQTNSSQTGNITLTLPNATGTFALTSNLNWKVSSPTGTTLCPALNEVHITFESSELNTRVIFNSPVNTLGSSSSDLPYILYFNSNSYIKFRLWKDGSNIKGDIDEYVVNGGIPIAYLMPDVYYR